ncbi:MAG: hypothetical protein KJ955_04265 [Nanoarchaeota archaeon]|nr:hypothetical protein [Nanoarchaeota archaeon]
MEWTFKLVIAIAAGLFAFFVMKKMTKWVFRIIIIGVIIAIIFYSSITLEDVKGVFKKEPASEPVIIEPVSEDSLEITENITTEEVTSLTEQEQQ